MISPHLVTQIINRKERNTYGFPGNSITYSTATKLIIFKFYSISRPPNHLRGWFGCKNNHPIWRTAAILKTCSIAICSALPEFVKILYASVGYHRTPDLAAVIATGCLSVCLSVCPSVRHAPVCCPDE